MDIKLMICEDCSYPPNFLTVNKPDESGRTISCVTCRDCGDYWEEPFDAEEIFFNSGDDE